MGEQNAFIRCDVTPDPRIGTLRIRSIRRAVIPCLGTALTLRSFCTEFPLNAERDLASPRQSYYFFLSKLASYSSLDSASKDLLAVRMVCSASQILHWQDWRCGLSVSVVLEEKVPLLRRARPQRLVDEELILEDTNESVRPSSGLSRDQISLLKMEQFCSNEGLSESCSVCLDQFCDGAVITPLSPCSHRFHNKCIVRWLQNHRTCPMCRAVCAV